jgi:hypothetical protein
MCEAHFSKDHADVVMVITDAKLPGDQIRNQLLGPQVLVESTFAGSLDQQIGQTILLLTRQPRRPSSVLAGQEPVATLGLELSPPSANGLVIHLQTGGNNQRRQILFEHIGRNEPGLFPGRLTSVSSHSCDIHRRGPSRQSAL